MTGRTQQVDALVGKLLLSEGARKESNLQYVQNAVLSSPLRKPMLRLYRKVIKGRRVEDEGQSPAQNQLKLSGLVKADGGALRVRNRIYGRVFDAAWVKQNTPVNWAAIMTAVAAVAVVVAVAALVLIGWNAIVNSQVEANVDTVANPGRTPKQRLASLASIFQSQAPLSPRDFDYRARAAFDDLDGAVQLELIRAGDVITDDLVTAVKGIYVTLADVDENGRTTPLLETMQRSLNGRRGSKQAAALANEIGAWLAARTQLRNGDLSGARAAYDIAIEQNKKQNKSADNPSTLFERAKVWIGLKEYRSALDDLGLVVAIARQQPMPAATPTPSLPPTSGASPTDSTPTSGATEPARPVSQTTQTDKTVLPTAPGRSHSTPWNESRARYTSRAGSDSYVRFRRREDYRCCGPPHYR